MAFTLGEKADLPAANPSIPPATSGMKEFPKKNLAMATPTTDPAKGATILASSAKSRPLARSSILNT